MTGQYYEHVLGKKVYEEEYDGFTIKVNLIVSIHNMNPSFKYEVKCYKTDGLLFCNRDIRPQEPIGLAIKSAKRHIDGYNDHLVSQAESQAEQYPE